MPAILTSRSTVRTCLASPPLSRRERGPYQVLFKARFECEDLLGENVSNTAVDGEADEVREGSARSRQFLRFPPRKTHVHRWDRRHEIALLESLALQRPRPVDHVGEDCNAESVRYHTAHSFDRRGHKDNVRIKAGGSPVARRGLMAS